MKKTLFAGIVLSFLLIIQANAQEKQYKVACVAFYNLENLFDTIDQPEVDDAEFLPNGSYNWNSERYYYKLNHMSDVISKIGGELVKGGPIVIGFSEIENRSVVEDLTKQPALLPGNYGIVHYDSPDRRGVDVALIYQQDHFKVLFSKSYRLTIPDKPDFLTRDQLLVSGLLDGELIHFIVNHWPSRRGGEKRSAPMRNAAASLTRHIADSLLNADSTAKIIIMGDLNDDPVNNSLRKFLKAKGSVEETKAGDLFNPMYKLFRDGIGSLAYRDSWNLFDQMIISYPLLNDNTGLKFFKAKVFNQPFLAQKEGSFAGYPWRTYVGTNFMGGYSDHFPVYLFLIKEKK